MRTDVSTKWVEVDTEHNTTGVRGKELFEVLGSKVYPEAYAKSQVQKRLDEECPGQYRVIAARMWNDNMSLGKCPSCGGPRPCYGAC